MSSPGYILYVISCRLIASFVYIHTQLAIVYHAVLLLYVSNV